VYTSHAKDTMEGKPFKNFVRGGLKDGFVKMSPYGKAVSAAARTKADGIKAAMLKGTFEIFKGPLKDNTGKEVIPAGTTIKQIDPVLESMNYLVDGVIGKV
jgi:basic membrane protein A